jgi:hypothetical protein
LIERCYQSATRARGAAESVFRPNICSSVDRQQHDLGSLLFEFAAIISGVRQRSSVAFTWALMEAVEVKFADWLKPNETPRSAMRKYLRRSL